MVKRLTCDRHSLCPKPEESAKASYLISEITAVDDDLDVISISPNVFSMQDKKLYYTNSQFDLLLRT